jgi:hypothetical protein
MTKAPVSTTEARKLLNLNKSRRGKYNANGQKIDGHWFASAAEAKRYVQLKDMQQDDLIEDLVLQPSYPIVHHGKPITTYRADFRYVVLNELKRSEAVVVEDVKGMVTDVYLIKKKLVEAQYNLKINEIPARDVDKWVNRTP